MQDVTAKPTGGHSGMIRNPRDLIGGIALIALSLFAFWAASDLPGMRGFSFGPGTAPRLFAGILLVIGIAIAATGIFTDGARLEKLGLRGPLFVTVAIFFFAFTIRPLGLVIASLVSFMVAGFAYPGTRWLETVISAVVLTTFCALLFPYALKLPFQLWPLWLRF